MGMTNLKFSIANPQDPEIKENLNFLIDSGAFFSIVPKKVLENLNINPVERKEFTLADGSTVKRDVGVALFRYEDSVGGASVVFGEEGDHSLLGATTLESMGLAINPFKRELMKLPTYLSRFY